MCVTQGNYLKVLRNLHTEQLSKVQWKHQQECDLLEDLRYFTLLPWSFLSLLDSRH